MALSKLLDVVKSSSVDNWTKRNKEAFSSLFGADEGRYPQGASQAVTVRAPEMKTDSGVPFAAYIHPSNPPSGAYSGTSFVIFPAIEESRPCLIGMGVGTQGLSPDESILGRSGHSRKIGAICRWLNHAFGMGKRVAWAKQDPTRTDIELPEDVKMEWPEYKPALEKYSREMYALFRPSDNNEATLAALTAFLDLLFAERGFGSLAKWNADAQKLSATWMEYLMPAVSCEELKSLLALRRYAILQGPPGTGKTKMAVDLLEKEYHSFGRSVQFHANTTYENFVGGLAPDYAPNEHGLQFRPSPGVLMEAANQASREPSRPYLLHIDEINRADLGKVLGEAIFLLEAATDSDRKISLPYDFGEPFHRLLGIPKNLHILGTMNSADRSIAIVDIAVRRRFAFLSLWPRVSVVQQNGCQLMQDAFQQLMSIFVEHASEDAFALVPGHSYFLEKDEERAKQRLKSELAPLLQEYLLQGYVGGFAEPIRSYLQRLDSL